MADKKGGGGKIEKKKTSTKWTAYEVSGNNLKRKNKSCPKCGHGCFMADHKDRSTCGKCAYTEFKSKK